MKTQKTFEHSDWDRDESYTEQDIKNLENAANVIVNKAKSLGINLKFSRHFFDQVVLKRGSGKIDYRMLMDAMAKFLKRGVHFFDDKPDLTSYAFQDQSSDLFLEILKSHGGGFLVRTVIRSRKWLGRSEKIVMEDELTEWSHTDAEIRDVLEKKGYKFLGKGVDQSAYLEPSTGQVLKIFGTASNTGAVTGLTADQEMFVAWADYCAQHKDNPYLPKFSGWKKFEFNGKTYLQIRMERLGNFPYDWDAGLEVLSYAVYHGVSFEVFMKLYQHGGDPAARTKGDDLVDELVVHLGGEGIQEIYETMIDLYRIGKANGWTFDLHRGNFLIRNDSTPVIVDPWVV